MNDSSEKIHFLVGLCEGTKLAVIGSRDFEDKEYLFGRLDKNKHKIALIVSGGATGADTFAKEWADSRAIPYLNFPAKWKLPDWTTDKGAGFRRNHQIISNCDCVLAMWDEESRGTAHSISTAKKLNKKVYVYNFRTKKSFAI
jgi:predicted Rossmann fold nucleotide-binding protein DprA/Smf involved in DNA uptake